MWYAGSYANSHLCASAHGRGTRGPAARPPFQGQLCVAPLPDPARQCAGRTSAPHRRAGELRRPDRARRATRVQRPGAGGPREGVVAAPSAPPRCLSTAAGRAIAGTAAPQPRSPREFDKPTSRWTLELAAAVSREQGLTPGRVTGETIRATLARLGIKWQRAKQWITSPDPEYSRKKAGATA